MHMAQLIPLPLTVSCFSKIQIGFTILVLAHYRATIGPLNGCFLFINNIKGTCLQECAKRFAHATSLRRHVAVTHADLDQFTCHQCARSFPTMSQVRAHVHTHVTGTALCSLDTCTPTRICPHSQPSPLSLSPSPRCYRELCPYYRGVTAVTAGKP